MKKKITVLLLLLAALLCGCAKSQEKPKDKEEIPIVKPVKEEKPSVDDPKSETTDEKEPEPKQEPDKNPEKPGKNENHGGGSARSISKDEFLKQLAAQPHYLESRKDRYLGYYASDRYTPAQVVRIVNTDNDMPYFTQESPADLSRGNLVLVNKLHPLGTNYRPGDLKELGNYGTWGSLRAEALEAFVALSDAAKAEGLTIIGVSPFRDYAKQNQLYTQYCNREGAAKADTYSARPGFSEHQTGLALDVAGRDCNLNNFGGTKEFDWMQAHAHEYGFILRYAEGMSYITGYMYEPWHYRYVGTKAAEEIHSSGLTLEEYYAYYVLKIK